MNTSKQLILSTQQTSCVSKHIAPDEEPGTSERKRIFNEKKTLDFGNIVLEHSN